MGNEPDDCDVPARRWVAGNPGVDDGMVIDPNILSAEPVEFPGQQPREIELFRRAGILALVLGGLGVDADVSEEPVKGGFGRWTALGSEGLDRENQGGNPSILAPFGPGTRPANPVAGPALRPLIGYLARIRYFQP